MSAKEDLRVQRTRKLLSDTLLDMMENKSIEQISVMDLCNCAMINRGTFYKHFEDKYSLLSFALEELKRDLHSDFSKRKPTDAAPQEALRSFFATSIQFFLNNHNRVANIVRHNMCGKVITAIEESISISLTNQLNEFANSYTIKVPIPILTQFLTGGLVNTMLWCINNDKTYTYQEYMTYLQFGYVDALFEKI